MNIKKLIKEEIDEFDWAVNHINYEDNIYDVGDTFIVKGDPTVYVINSVNNIDGGGAC